MTGNLARNITRELCGRAINPGVAARVTAESGKSHSPWECKQRDLAFEIIDFTPGRSEGTGKLVRADKQDASGMISPGKFLTPAR